MPAIVLEVARRRLHLGREAGDRDHLEAVAVGEVAEGVVGGDELAPVAVGEPGAILPVERTQLGGELPGRGLASQLRADPLHDLSEPHGVEPDMRVRAAVLLAQLEPLEDVDRRHRRRSSAASSRAGWKPPPA